MMQVRAAVRAIGRFLIGIVLVLFVILFVLTITTTYQINDNTVYEIASSAAAGAYISQIQEHSDGEADAQEVYDELIAQCTPGVATVQLGDSGLEANCDELRAAGVEGAEEYIYSIFFEGVRDSTLSQLAETEIGGVTSVAITMGRVSAWFLGGITLVLVGVLFILSVPRYHFLIDMGIILAIAGLPFIVFASLNISFMYSWADEVNTIVAGLLSTLRTAYLTTFIIGIVSLIGGIFWKIAYTKHEGHAETKS